LKICIIPVVVETAMVKTRRIKQFPFGLKFGTFDLKFCKMYSTDCKQRGGYAGY
jgi:hypothetical protein